MIETFTHAYNFDINWISCVISKTKVDNTTVYEYNCIITEKANKKVFNALIKTWYKVDNSWFIFLQDIKRKVDDKEMWKEIYVKKVYNILEPYL